MKMKLFLLLALVLSAAAVQAQSSPSAAATTTAPSLTKEERASAVAYLEQSGKEFVAAINSVSDAQWKFKSAPDRWSIAECAEHIAVTEEMIWKLVSEKMMKSPATPEKRAEVAGKDEIILQRVPDRSRKAQAPEQLKPTGRWATRTELLKHFDTIRTAEIAYLKETNEDLRDHFEEHPAFKTMDAYQWLIFNGAHGKRHTAQIEEVKTDANYPKS